MLIYGTSVPWCVEPLDIEEHSLTLKLQIWDIFENKPLFNALDEDREYSPSHHVAEMVAYLGLPPLHFLQRSEETRNVFDEKG